ncbi:MAG: HNH endonuclease [Parvibaculum sp.]|uniref:EVE domain-containing protein n=1 Tax=Parvibaculum sp. TaxID=2024848 RepID=UPI001D47F1FF|nr:EVE domain-containing protein [Parvibaculum sp.]MBX3489666.1 HNH endonuclease [Parvibaculum sp.]MBX3494718.1 HNH endonuclease [Parvibaculum sp.]MCW5726376.1 HNH endonuclease [Parvibaculum sp.]
MSFWLFRTSIEKYRVRDALEDLGKLTWDVWRNSEKFGPISVGDYACLFESGTNGGIYGIVEVTDSAKDRAMSSVEREYITDINKFKPTDYRVIVAPTTNLSLQLPVSHLKEDAFLSLLPVFAEMGFSKQANIFPLKEDQYREILRSFSDNSATRQHDEDIDHDIPTDDHRRFANRRTPVRPGQPAFRRMILEAYRHRCAITNCDVKTALEASHIGKYFGPRSDRIYNGVLLRVDLHRLFDAHLISIDPDSWKVRISPAISHSTYAKWEGHPFRVPERDDQKPNKKELKEHLLKTIGE